MTIYTQRSASEPMHENALVSEAPKLFIAFSGDAVLIQAHTPEEAEKKYRAFHDGNTCPCGIQNCECVKEDECQTVIQEI